MKISVIIPAYNCAGFVEHTIGSVLSQDYAPDQLEIVIVNDGSTDDTATVLEKYAGRCTIVHTENQGVSAARNTGLLLSTGKYIQYLDSDDLLYPGKLRIQAEMLEREDADVAYSDWEKFKGDGNHRQILEQVQRAIPGRPEIELFTDFWCPPAAMLYSRRITDRIGSWNMNLPVIQDARYAWDAASRGGKFVYTPGMMAGYRVSDSASLSTRSRSAFMNDCLRNAQEIYGIWKDDLSKDAEKKDALIKVLRFCVTEFSVSDKKNFNQAIDLILTIDPRYVPAQSRGMHYLSRLIGYKNAEQVASVKRRLR
jgi:glycosyltransferase involved in cell wall biosynthesis